MDADLARAARGQAVAPETEEMATQVLRGVGAVTTVSSAPTEIVQRPVDGRTGVRPAARVRLADRVLRVRRADAAPVDLAVAARACCWSRPRSSPAGTSTPRSRTSWPRRSRSTVPFVEGIKEVNAVAKIRDAGLNAVIIRRPTTRCLRRFVVTQDPGAGTHTDKGNPVTIVVSTGLPKVDVPNVVGKQATDAVAVLTDAGAEGRRSPSQLGQGDRHRHRPGPGRRQERREGDEGADQRLAGAEADPDPAGRRRAVRAGRGRSSRAPASPSRAATSTRTTRGAPSSQQDPAANSLASKGATVTLCVSKGPTSRRCPTSPASRGPTRSRRCATRASRWRWRRQ